MSEFETYLWLGFHHIADVNAYDHIVFIIALCAVYQPWQWRVVLLLVTAFTAGHSITLALATLGFIPIPAKVIEFLIPVTIFLTCLFNVLGPPDGYRRKKIGVNYPLAMFFGLIHGMGFSHYLRALLGQEESIALPLFSFNAGLEIGQLLIVGCVMIGASVMVYGFRAPHRSWNLFISGAAAGVSVVLMSQTKFW
jgi:hypothetical protein